MMHIIVVKPKVEQEISIEEISLRGVEEDDIILVTMSLIILG
jgi:hypothetical protein